jgi:hypothetical protein
MRNKKGEKWNTERMMKCDKLIEQLRTLNQDLEASPNKNTR